MSEEGVVKPVAEFVASFEGNQNCSRPSTIFPVGMDVIRNAQVPEVIKEVFGLKEKILSKWLIGCGVVNSKINGCIRNHISVDTGRSRKGKTL